MLWKNDAVDLAINNQRRAFLSSLETEDLKNTPCILVINQTGQQDTACKEPGSCQKTYCAFWEKDNSEYYIEEFADILKSCF